MIAYQFIDVSFHGEKTAKLLPKKLAEIIKAAVYWRSEESHVMNRSYKMTRAQIYTQNKSHCT